MTEFEIKKRIEDLKHEINELQLILESRVESSKKK